MLVEFKVKNFRSFKEEAVLSMVASADKSLPENSTVVENFGNRRILHSAVVYGANAAGKTNLISAAAFVDRFVNTSAERKVNEVIDVQPFLLTEEPTHEPTEFELTFIDEENVRYQYGFQLNSEKIIREWLVAYPKGSPQTWFEREFNDESETGYVWSFGRHLKGQNSQIAAFCRPDVLYLSNAAKLNHNQLGKVFHWFQKRFHMLDANKATDLLSMLTPENLKKDRSLEEDIFQFLNAADLGISGYDMREEVYQEQDFPDDLPAGIKYQLVNKKYPVVTMRHSVGENREVYLPLEAESIGTRQLFGLSIPISSALKHGWTLFVDELDSSLHPLLVQYILKLFHNPETNPHGAQLIFNTHDTTIMDQELFRRDQIWFVEKDRQGCSHLYSLLEYSPRNKESLAKNYLQGRYGSIPFLGN